MQRFPFLSHRTMEEVMAIEAESLDTHQQLEIAVKALLDVKGFTVDNQGSTLQRVFVTARDALIQIGRNPAPLKRG